MYDSIAFIQNLSKDWSGLKRYGPAVKKYKGRCKEKEDEGAGEPKKKSVRGNNQDKTEMKDEASGFEIVI